MEVKKMSDKSKCVLCFRESKYTYQFVLPHKDVPACLCRKCAANVTKLFLEYVKHND